MDELDKVRIDAYIMGKHMLSLAATKARVRGTEAELNTLDTEIEEHKIALASLKEMKTEVAAVLSGYKKAAAEKQ